jgi:hypothetical protein
MSIEFDSRYDGPKLTAESRTSLSDGSGTALPMRLIATVSLSVCAAVNSFVTPMLSHTDLGGLTTLISGQ